MGDYWNSEIETMQIADLRKLQEKRLRYVLKYVYERNPHYKDHFERNNFHPDDFKSLNDMKNVPFIDKTALREYYPMKLACVPYQDMVEVHSSSGTTGKLVIAPYTRKDLEIWTEVMARTLYAAGVRADSILQNTFGYGLFTGAHGAERGAQKIGALVLPLSAGITLRQLQFLRDMEASHICCTPSYFLHMAEVAEQERMNPKEEFPMLKTSIHGAEVWSEEIRKRVENTWNVEAFDIYGLTEAIGPGVSYECSSHSGLHINADHFYLEVIDPVTGELLSSDDEKGELVITTVTKEAFPLIRFRTRDRAKLIEEKCSCGRTTPRHTRIMGRIDDMMKIKGAIVFPLQIEEAILAASHTSGNYLIIKEKKGVFTDLRIQVEPTPYYWEKGDLDQLAMEVQAKIQSYVGLTLLVEVVKPGSLPRSIGKAQRVEDRTK